MNEAWLERWREGRIGWHEPDGNSSLKRYWDGRGRRVLVPLCGKSADLMWLESQGNSVTGVELSRIAVEGFFEDNRLEYRTPSAGRYEAVDRNLTLVCGDYFRFSSGPAFDALYDRGALVALPAELRQRYVEHTKELLTADARLLLISVDYDQSRAEGPPFALAADEIHGYWPDLTCVDRYDDLANCPPKFRDAGLTAFDELVWRTPVTTAPS